MVFTSSKAIVVRAFFELKVYTNVKAIYIDKNIKKTEYVWYGVSKWNVIRNS